MYAIFRKRSFKYDYWAGIHQKVPAWSLTTSREVSLVKHPELNLVPREGFYFTLYVNQDSKAKDGRGGGREEGRRVSREGISTAQRELCPGIDRLPILLLYYFFGIQL